MNVASTAYFFSPFLGTSTSLATPIINLLGDDFRLSFLHAQKEWSSRVNSLRVEISIDVGGAWEEIVTFDYNIDVPTTSDFNLSPFGPAEQSMIRFTATSDFGYATLLDDISSEYQNLYGSIRGKRSF